MGDPVVHIEIAVTDGLKSAAFYHQLFGWESEVVESSGGSYRMLELGDGAPTVGLGSWPRVHPYVTFYVGVRELEESVDRARGLGSEVMMEPREVGHGRWAALIRDPDGNMIGLFQLSADGGA